MTQYVTKSIGMNLPSANADLFSKFHKQAVAVFPQTYKETNKPINTAVAVFPDIYKETNKPR